MVQDRFHHLRADRVELHVSRGIGRVRGVERVGKIPVLPNVPAYGAAVSSASANSGGAPRAGAAPWNQDVTERQSDERDSSSSKSREQPDPLR